MNDPYFNFGEYYSKGDTLYYIYNNELMSSRELIKVSVRTIYPRVIIGTDEEGRSFTIDISEADRIFREKAKAEKYYKETK